MRNFSIIVAFDDQQGIGKNNALPWKLSADLQHFKAITTAVSDPAKQNALIMGRKTWESLPQNFRPLPNRLNLVLSRIQDLKLPEGVLNFITLQEALAALEKNKNIEHIFVIGGASVYAQAIHEPHCRKIFATHLQGDFACDAFFPSIPSRFKKTSQGPWLKENAISYRFDEFLS